MDMRTKLLDVIERHPCVEDATAIPREDRRAILVAYRNETDSDLLVEVFRGAGWDADEAENRRYEQVAAACWRAVNGNQEDIDERDRLIAEWLWHVAQSDIEDALQEVRAEELA